MGSISGCDRLNFMELPPVETICYTSTLREYTRYMYFPTPVSFLHVLKVSSTSESQVLKK